VPHRRWFVRSDPQPGAPGLHTLSVTREEWHQVAQDMAAADGRLLALWASPAKGAASNVHAVFLAERSGLVVNLSIDGDDPPYPGLEDIFPAAARMQRAVRDLCGLQATTEDARPWLRHAAWPPDFRPMIDPPPAQAVAAPGIDRYEFVRVQGDGVHEIPVGPVHAGIIEPGHFRFSIVGEKVLRLEERLGYAHKGIERRFTEFSAAEGHRLAARVSGDCAVAFSWAYCQALEALSGCTIPDRATRLRALCLEIERIQNHLGDLGALGNDAGFGFGLSQFSRLKEELLRTNQLALGQRYLLDAIVPGGMSVDLSADGSRELAERMVRLTAETRLLKDIYDDHAGLRDRFVGAGQVTPELARRLGLIGLPGRASGQSFDARVDLPSSPYDQYVPAKAVRSEGDVAARVAVRFEELYESCRLVQLMLEKLPGDAHRAEIAMPASDTLGIGLIEGWRGPVLVALEVDRNGMIRRCHPHDPSWQNWPVLEHAIIGNIVPDFPLINKSFNLSYSGHDL
jgi:Ni,Fe-hydrogenase III large subunit/Ni,Fe-hydrogenase III component G